MMLPFKKNNRVTQIYSTKHGGIDVVGDDDKNVLSVSDGVVDYVQFWNGKSRTGSQSYGNLVRILSNEGIYIYYAHLSEIFVKKGERVKLGDILGIMGNTGNSYGAHLHIEARTGKAISTRICPTRICSLENIKGIYPQKSNAKKPLRIFSGMQVQLCDEKLYVSSTAKNYSCRKSGIFYIYSDKIINNRVRITCKKSYVSKSPASKFVTGWIEADKI